MSSFSKNNYINIWDLYNKKIFKVIYIGNYLDHIIRWDNEYAIVTDYNNKAIKIIDI